MRRFTAIAELIQARKWKWLKKVNIICTFLLIFGTHPKHQLSPSYLLGNVPERLQLGNIVRTGCGVLKKSLSGKCFRLQVNLEMLICCLKQVLPCLLSCHHVGGFKGWWWWIYCNKFMIKTPQNLQKVLPCLLGHLDHHLVDQRGHRQGGCHHLYIQGDFFNWSRPEKF